MKVKATKFIPIKKLQKPATKGGGDFFFLGTIPIGRFTLLSGSDVFLPWETRQGSFPNLWPEAQFVLHTLADFKGTATLPAVIYRIAWLKRVDYPRIINIMVPEHLHNWMDGKYITKGRCEGI